MKRGLRRVGRSLAESALHKVLGRYAWPLLWNAGTATSPHPRWEYNEAVLPAERTLSTLNDLGREGWEVLAIDRRKRKLYMKRKREEAR